jgi:hypothetical protein
MAAMHEESAEPTASRIPDERDRTCRLGRLAELASALQDQSVEQGPLIYRAEVTAILQVLGDLNVHLREIHELLEEEFRGEEEEEDDS